MHASIAFEGSRPSAQIIASGFHGCLWFPWALSIWGTVGTGRAVGVPVGEPGQVANKRGGLRAPMTVVRDADGAVYCRRIPWLGCFRVCIMANGHARMLGMRDGHCESVARTTYT